MALGVPAHLCRGADSRYRPVPHLDCRGLLCNQTARPLSRTGDSAPRTRSSTPRLITFAAENASVEVVGIACLRQPLRFGPIFLQPVGHSSTLSYGQPPPLPV